MIYCRNYRSIFPLTPTEVARLVARIEESDSPDGCWLWTGARGVGGYGQVSIRGAIWQVHRMVYELLVGPVPAGCVLHHTCGDKCCCNPAHLEVVTQAENMARGRVTRDPDRPRRLKASCRRGHKFSPDNTGWQMSRGRRIRLCLTCQAAANARRNERRKLKRAAAALRPSADASLQSQVGG
jgi:hypothetical protein